MVIRRKHERFAPRNKDRIVSDVGHEVSGNIGNSNGKAVLCAIGFVSLLTSVSLFSRGSSALQDLANEHDYHVSCIHEAINNPDEPLYCTANNPEDNPEQDVCLWSLNGGQYGEFSVDMVTAGYSFDVVSYRVGQEGVLGERGFDISNADVFSPTEQNKMNFVANEQIFNRCMAEASEKFGK